MNGSKYKYRHVPRTRPAQLQKCRQHRHHPAPKHSAKYLEHAARHRFPCAQSVCAYPGHSMRIFPFPFHCQEKKYSTFPKPSLLSSNVFRPFSNNFLIDCCSRASSSSLGRWIQWALSRVCSGRRLWNLWNLWSLWDLWSSLQEARFFQVGRCNLQSGASLGYLRRTVDDGRDWPAHITIDGRWTLPIQVDTDKSH